MNCKACLLAAVVTLSLLCPATATAMSLIDFGRMNNDDDASYVTLLVEGAAKILKARSRPDLANKAIALFHDPGPNGGVHQFALNLRQLNTVNNRNATNPNNRAPVYGVEDAMAQTLKDAGLNITAADLLAIGQDFRPVGPPRSQITIPPTP
jgi:hypothetical protein